MNAVSNLRVPLTYWGGKQTLAERIVLLLAKHTGYVEPFCGGAAVFWRKPQSKWEVLNDTNRELMNFYEQVKSNFSELETLVRMTLYSREAFRDAEAIYARPNLHSPVKRAWAVWMLCNTSYSSVIGNIFSTGSSAQKTTKMQNKKKDFIVELATRLENAQIESCDALRIIRSRDTAQTLFYCDPPYIGADQGHYNGYSEADYQALLNELAQIQGKFLLSSYRSAPLKEAVAKHGWHSVEIECCKFSSYKGNKKIECLTANYPISL